jgi:5-methylcytosine-specific restriction endonuclease McrA
VRELREDEGWKILTSNDDAGLKTGEYLLKEAPPENSKVAFSRNISKRLRAEVLDRNGFTCQMCGLTPGEIDPETGRKVRLHIGHIVDKSIGGKEELSNLRALCSTCNQGAKNVTTQKPTTIWLLSQIRRAGQDEQRAVLKWLREKFKE